MCRKTLKHCMCIYQKLSFSTDPLMSINRCNCLKWLKLLKFVSAYLICLFHRAFDGGVTRVCREHVPPSNQGVHVTVNLIMLIMLGILHCHCKLCTVPCCSLKFISPWCTSTGLGPQAFIGHVWWRLE